MVDETQSGVTTPETKKRKAPSSAWKPGQSGNPGGFPKELAAVQALARSHTPAAISALVKIVESDNAPPAAIVAAANSILDRAWGRPAQPIEAAVTTGITFILES